jgi:sigma-B regulation protein RsbU (phosphoserine phosphatase)
MFSEEDLITKLTTLNRIAEALNRAVDVRGVLDDALADLVELLDLETAWVFLRDPAAEGRRWGSGYVLAAHHNLPPGLDPEASPAWEGKCICQQLADDESLDHAHNQVNCSRLASVSGDRGGLAVHATVALRAGGRLLGILNLAADDWSAFTPATLSLLTTVGNQMGTALERARLYDLVRERRGHEQEALLRLSRHFLTHLDLDELIPHLVSEVMLVLRADACALMLPGESPELLEFRAASGWRIDPVAAHRLVPADPCTGPGLVMESQRLFQVEDLSQEDPTCWAPDWLQAEGFKGHAVVPLLAGGRSIGALVVNQRQPRLLDETDLRCLQLMANQAALAIEKARLHQQEIKAQGFERELSLGREIQLGLLPDAPPVIPGWEIATFYHAAREVGGDFYDFVEDPADPTWLGLLIGDVSGKGVPAALEMARSCTMLRTTALQTDSPAATLARVNDLILRNGHADLFLTALYARLDPYTGRLTFANAGHCRPLWFRADRGEFVELASHGMILGAFERIVLEQRTIDVGSGDLLVFYTDGVTEAMNGVHELFGVDRLQAAVAASCPGSPHEVIQSIVDAVTAHAHGIPQSDDMAILALRRL